MSEQFLERRIITGLIVSTQYIRRIRKAWNPRLLESKTAKKVASWCIDYFDQFNKAPGKDVETIFYSKAENLQKEEAEDIESILDGLSDEYSREEKFNVDYLLQETWQYLDKRNLKEFADDIVTEVTRGKLSEAKKLASEYKPVSNESGTDIDMSDPRVLKEIEKAFAEAQEPLIKYPRQIGQFWNRQLVRGGFIALMGPEKRGKSFWMLDMAMRAARQKCKVAFFQAGDMSRHQQLRRMSIYLTKKSDWEESSGKMYQPVRDCVHNQMDTCNKDERECDHGVFTTNKKEDEQVVRDKIRHEITMDELIEARKQNPDYKPCHNCLEYWKKKNRMGATWVTEVDTGDPLTVREAQKSVKEFFIDRNRRFKFASYPNSTLTYQEMNTQLDLWEKQDDFVADVIIVDFADIMAPEINAQPRDQINDMWSKLRGMSLSRHCLVVTGTWSDAGSYGRDRLSKSNFSEDKRKLGHTTATFGLNQDKDWREKEIGLMRINKIVLREGDYKETDEVFVLQNLSRGQPCLGSYW